MSLTKRNIKKAKNQTKEKKKPKEAKQAVLGKEEVY
jgi:hypothetical protein